jgi:hypothetical protein
MNYEILKPTMNEYSPNKRRKLATTKIPSESFYNFYAYSKYYANVAQFFLENKHLLKKIPKNSKCSEIP